MVSDADVGSVAYCKLPSWGSIASPLLLLFSLRLMSLSLESRRILPRWELPCPIVLCHRSAGTCKAASAVAFAEGSDFIGARANTWSKESIA